MNQVVAMVEKAVVDVAFEQLERPALGAANRWEEGLSRKEASSTDAVQL
jgi:hypothetical protein